MPADGSTDAFVPIARQLYRVPPGEFTAERARQVSVARSSGRRDLAVAIAALRRPTMPAWAVNLLVTVHRAEVEDLVELGRRLRDLPTSPTGDQLRAFSEQRSTMVRDLVSDAQSVAQGAGVRLSRQAVIEVEQTLRAGLADADAADAILSGMLERPLQYAGLGFTGDAMRWAGIAAGLGPSSTAGGAAVADTGGPSPDEAGEHVRATAQRRQRHEAALQAVEAARRADAAAAQAAVEAAGVLAAAQLRVAIAQQELRAAEEAEGEAERTSDAAADKLTQAGDALVAAEQALAPLEE